MAVGACSAADSTIHLTHDPCAGVTIAGDGTAAEDAGIDGAIALWGARGVTLTHAPNDPAIQIVFEAAAGSFHGIYDDDLGIIYINTDLVDQPLAIVVAHELGHAFGLVHVTDRTSLMNPGNLVTPPTADDHAAVVALWGQCSEP